MHKKEYLCSIILEDDFIFYAVIFEEYTRVKFPCINYKYNCDDKPFRYTKELETIYFKYNPYTVYYKDGRNKETYVKHKIYERNKDLIDNTYGIYDMYDKVYYFFEETIKKYKGIKFITHCGKANMFNFMDFTNKVTEYHEKIKEDYKYSRKIFLGRDDVFYNEKKLIECIRKKDKIYDIKVIPKEYYRENDNSIYLCSVKEKENELTTFELLK